jgi:hypothetical protein
VKWRLGTLLTATLVVTVACDPGMTISQASAPEAGKGARVAVNVKTSHPLVGETWYAPDAQVTNSSESPITVTGVELSARGVTYANRPGRPGTYPLIVAPGKTDALDIWFDLSDDVKKTLQQAAGLRVHYRVGDREEVAEVKMIAGPLNTNAR